MAVKRIGDIIEMSQELHSSMQNILKKKVDAATTTGLTSALEYLESIEEETKSVIEEIPEPQRDNVLATFVRYYPIDEEDEARQIIENNDANDIPTLMNSMIKLQQKLIDIYDFCAIDAQIPEVKKLMESIRNYEVTKLHEVSRQLSEYQFQR